MHTATLHLTLSRADHDLRVAARYVSLPTWIMRGVAAVAAPFFAGKIRRLAEKLSNDVLKVVDLTRLVDDIGTPNGDQIDPDGALATLFSGLLADIECIRHSGDEVVNLASRLKSDKIAAAARQFAAVCAEHHQAVAGLAWAIAEHDATYAPRLAGYIATTPEEIAAMLERITAGE